jgi:predicted secreted protein
MPASTSGLGPAVSIAGLLLQVDNGSSPDAFQTIANVDSITYPMTCETVDVTNVGNLWKAMFPTLHNMGKIAFKIFWIPEEPTHRNSPTAGSTGAGLMWLFLNANAANNAGLRNWQLVIPDGNNSTIAFEAYVTSFAIDIKVGNVFTASIELTNNGVAPSLP